AQSGVAVAIVMLFLNLSLHRRQRVRQASHGARCAASLTTGAGKRNATLGGMGSGRYVNTTGFNQNYNAGRAEATVIRRQEDAFPRRAGFRVACILQPRRKASYADRSQWPEPPPTTRPRNFPAAGTLVPPVTYPHADGA